MPDTKTVDLTNCDREPIHVPGSIQPHGCLIACDAAGSGIVRHSTNAPQMLGLPQDINGMRLDEALGPEVAHTLRNAIATSSDPARPALRHGVILPSGQRFDVSIHAYEANAILEFEPVSGDTDQPLEAARMLISRIRNIRSVDQLVERSSRLIHALLGYDRVMIYRLDKDGSGKVISEHKRRDLESFKGQHFPATDIPQQARILYLMNTIRVISDADNPRVAIVPALDEAGAPLDLSFAHLRSVSPIHCEYLRNMGVSASMSISIVVDGELWGLIACHHYSRKALSMPQRVAAETFGEFFSLHLSALKQKEIAEKNREVRSALDRFLQAAAHHSDIRELLRQSLDELSAMLPSDGVGLWLSGVWTAAGSAPSKEGAAELAELLAEKAGGRVWETHHLSVDLPTSRASAEGTCGVIAVPLSQRSRDYLFFFRRELVQTLDWAGNPEKAYESGPLGDRLTPRKSFAVWKETVSDQAQPWSDGDLEVADAIRAVLVEIVLHHNELIADERGKADVRQRMLNEELNHRVKNILSVIKSLIGSPVDPGQDIESYIESLKGRVQALSLAHDQIVRSGDGGMLRDLLHAELQPYQAGDRRIVLQGPPIWLDARSFSVMALVLHEMATNAAKYGGLSRSGGDLSVRWSRSDTADCEIRWEENGGPPVTAPVRSGFGSVLIGRSVSYELGGKSRIDYDEAGLRGYFCIPSTHIQAGGEDEERQLIESALDEGDQEKSDFSEVELLLVEDQMLIAADVETILAEYGLKKVTTSPSVAEALRKLEHFAPNIAILDVNLGTGTSVPVAHELLRRGIPFVFATGYSDRATIPDHIDVPVLRKPYEASALIRAIARLLAQTRVD
ncbi:light-regulated signal transduction histidine kinase (bacteriophytochrome) [Pseudorhizobium tarimense]|uniref:histidine kinase n=1 Tax=Pseudorhizobium tarimense TaxID=1079109 RepID=A0ABV2HCD6_9HYPH|nr:HWE histidine kinase domain-containing protein [Pseudorhizobium tarimense]MCJ8521264.1 GAF domain-containing protein [Pseudorhizobium tarimense]